MDTINYKVPVEYQQINNFLSAKDSVRNDDTYDTYAALTARLEDIEAAYQRTLSGDLPGDEEHCACVPHLRRRIAELEADDKAWEDLTNKLNDYICALAREHSVTVARIAELEAQAGRVCKWTFSTDQHTAEFSLYKSQCGNDFDMLPTDYCYMCGGKVEVTK